MERIDKDFGALVMSGARIYGIEGGQSADGLIFKDYDAFKTGQGLCYVSEYGLEEILSQLDDLEEEYKAGKMSEDEYLETREFIILHTEGETRQTIIDQVREAYADDYLLTDAQVEAIAEGFFNLADWAYICTYLQDAYNLEDCIEYDRAGIFTELQHEAIDKGMYPRELVEIQ